jgi:hypothetical protein
MLRSLTLRVLSSGGMFFVLLALFAVALVLILAMVFVARLMLTVLLIAVAPLALACHALPQTEGIARWWWRAFAGLLLIQSAQALVLVAAARVFLSEQWVTLTAPASSCPLRHEPQASQSAANDNERSLGGPHDTQVGRDRADQGARLAPWRSSATSQEPRMPRPRSTTLSALTHSIWVASTRLCASTAVSPR